jgi:CheY-like chemotaxis protein
LLEVDLPQDLWPVNVDAGELELACVNLAVNARDAMPNGGVFSVSARNVTLSPGDLGLDLRGEFVALAFRDSGYGIAPDILPKVFDPFFTTKQVSKGTGLGLSQVHGFAHQAGGGIAIESTLGEGTAITVVLPRSLALPSEAGAETGAAAAAEGGGHILVVEDNPDVAAVSAAILEQLGYEVRIAPDAQTALDILAAGEPVDLVFSDIVMAGEMDGVALAHRLREAHPELPILLTSGYSRAAEAAQSQFPILRKPYQIAEVGGAIARLIAESRAEPDDKLVRFPARRANSPPGAG